MKYKIGIVIIILLEVVLVGSMIIYSLKYGL